MPIIADIDAGFGNAEATYLLAKKMIEAGACALQIENQVSDEKQCGHQDGKVTVPHEDFLAKIRAVRYAFLELGVDDGVIVARTDSLGAGLTKQIAFSHAAGRHRRPVQQLPRLRGGRAGRHEATATSSSTATASCCARSACRRNLFQFRAGTGEDRCVLDCITSLQNGADLLWIETEKPHIEQIAGMVDRIREVDPERQAGLQQLARRSTGRSTSASRSIDAWRTAGKDVSAYDRAKLMSVDYDATELAAEADEKHPHLPGATPPRGRASSTT